MVGRLCLENHGLPFLCDEHRGGMPALPRYDDSMVREQRARLPHGTVRYLESGTGWPVVLLHAFPLGADMWRPQLEQVPEGWRYIAPDLRGFGPAARGHAETMDDFGADVFALLNELQIDRTALGGLSMGGYVAFAMIRHEPARFNALVLADTRASADSEAGRRARSEMLDAVSTKGAAAVADMMLPKLLGRTTREQRPALEQQVRRMIEANGADGISGAIRAMMARPDSTSLLETVNVPVLLIVGDEDIVTPPADSEAMARRLARCNVVTLPRTGHLSSMEAPREFAAALADFLTSPL
jgi:pimeloyl-ACP methyl ester carboxylesterase